MENEVYLDPEIQIYITPSSPAENDEEMWTMLPLYFSFYHKCKQIVCIR